MEKKSRKPMLFTSIFDYFYLIIGALLSAVAASVFYTPARLTGGGATGIGAIFYYVFGVLGFPHPGGLGYIVMLGLLTVLSSQGFGIFVFGVVPSLRMSMSICCLWAVLSYSLSGTAFPLSAMDSELKTIALLFPLRHYYMVYQLNIFNGYSIGYSWPYVVALLFFAALPLLVAGRIKKNMMTYEYIP